MDVNEKWYCVKEVSAIFGCSVDTVRRLVKVGRLKAIRLTVNSTKRKRTFITLRIAGSEVDRFIKANPA